MIRRFRSQCGDGAADRQCLLEIAEVLDLVSQRRGEAYAGAAAGDDSALRAALFALLDQPTQETWEEVREVEVFPTYLPGLSTPSPLGMTLGDIVYSRGLPDRDCPSRSALLVALRWAAAQLETPIQG